MSSSGNFPLTFKLQVQGDTEIVNKFKQITAAMNQISPAATKTAQAAKQARKHQLKTRWKPAAGWVPSNLAFKQGI